MATFDQIVTAKAVELGKLSIRETTAAGSGHPTTALSLGHLVTVLMYRVMRWDPTKPHDLGADRLVLSEGHAVPIIYAACADIGVTFYPHGRAKVMNTDDALTLRAIDSAIDGHPNPQVGFPLFDAATGSLGQGLSVAAGLAGAARIDGVEKVVYCIIGDGESREGQIWEAMDFIADQKLTGVVAIFNCNGLGQSDYVSPAQNAENLAKKAEAFGWKTITIDGHNGTAIENALKQQKDAAASGKPLCILAKTVKGWGAKSVEGLGHHGTPIEEKDVAGVFAELDKTAAELGAANINKDEIAKALLIHKPLPAPAAKSVGKAATFGQTIAADAKMAEAVNVKKKLSPRRAWGLALKALGASNPNVVALDADVKNSTYTQDFAKAYPKNFFECKIAEQNMMSAAAGLSSGGKIPFASTFGKFMVRGFDQIEMALIGGSNLKLVGTHVGVTLAADGPSQMALADVAFMRAIAHATDTRGNPVVTILTPSDAVSAYNLTLAMADFPSACYMRAVRADLPLLYGENETFAFGGFKITRKAGAGPRKIAIVANGYMVHTALKAAADLAKQGVEAGVIDAYCLPFNTADMLALAAEHGNTFLTVEDNYVGGIGSELAEAAADGKSPAKVHCMVVRNIPKSGRTPEEVLDYVHLGQADIVKAALEALKEEMDGLKTGGRASV